jgi:hypothetical protein
MWLTWEKRKHTRKTSESDRSRGAPLSSQLLDRAHDRPPHSGALGVTFLKQLIRPLGRSDRGILAVLVDQQLGGAVDVEVGDQCRRPRTASTWAAIAVASVGK